MKIFKYDIRLSTFLQKGVPNIDNPWGNIMITGFQGSGKTYLSIFLLKDLIKSFKPQKIYTNINSLNLKNIIKFKLLDDILDNTEENVIFIIDELSKKYTKNSPQDKKLYSWLQQSRKRGRIVILITQEWKEVPTWLRRPIRFMYTTHRLGLLPLFLTTKGDALNLTYNIDTNEWECPVIDYIIYKRTKSISKLYDTFEPINDL